MKICYPLSLLLFLFVSSLVAQPSRGQWQWAEQAGGVDNFNSLENELVQDICTDKFGNVYVTGTIYGDPFFGNLQYTAPFSSFGRGDAFVAKYDKCGNLKWARFGGGTAQDFATSIHVDDSSNVYILGAIASNNATFPDSNHTLTTGGGLFWAKYDSVGNIKWVKSAHNSLLPSLTVSLIPTPSGNLSTIILMGVGTFYPGFSFTSTHYGLGLFEFDLNGNPVNVYSIDSSNDANLSNEISALIYDSKGNIIMNIGIIDTTRLFDTLFYDPVYNTRDLLLKINTQTHKIMWIKEWQEDQFQQSGFGSILIDDHDNLIADGATGQGAIFNGDTLTFNSTAATSQEVCFKLDSNGNTLWKIIADNTNSANVSIYGEPISFFGDKYVCVPINVSGPTYWGGDTFNLSGTTYVMTFVNINTGKTEYGYPIQEGANTLNTALYKIISDEQGNIYWGGYFSASLAGGSDTVYYVGGNNDAFVLKWGLPCADTSALVSPLAAEGLVANASGAHSIDLDWHNVAQYADRYRVYRSSADSINGYLLIDSVSKYTSHYTDATVSANQVYWYHVSAVNNAGETFSNADSSMIHTVGIAEANSSIRHIALYPNPANNYTQLSIWSDATTSMAMALSVTDMEGRGSYSKSIAIAQGKNDFTIDISGIGAGIYIVNLRSDNETYSKRLVVLR